MTSNTWSTATFFLLQSSLAGASVGNLALFGGGDDIIDRNYVDIYDVSTNTWSIATLSQAQSTLTATTVDNLTLFASSVNSSAYSNHVEIFQYCLSDEQ